MQNFVVWWLKRDLRISENQALHSGLDFARKYRFPLLALWIVEPEAYAAEEYHPRRERFVLECLADLEAELRGYNVMLCIAEGTATRVFQELIGRGLKGVFSHQETGVLWTYQRDRELKSLFQKSGVLWLESPTNGVVRGLKDRDSWQQIFQARMAGPCIPAPHKGPDATFDSITLASIVLTGDVKILNWAAHAESKIARAAASAPRNQQKGGLLVAKGLLNRFLAVDVHKRYSKSLASPHESRYFSSRLSPYLAFGCLSSREILAALSQMELTGKADLRSLTAFRSRLAWRCHFVQKLESFPEMERLEQNPALADLRPPMTREELQRWEAGMTGFPLIDACLRCVHQTGYLNFRMRAMLMSFATHLMWRDWRIPSWDLARAFLDFEPGIHFSQVQMQAAVTGNNQIRIYNPCKQSAENDPNAIFIKQWVPELKDIAPSAIHDAKDLPGKYPTPIVDLNQAMASARETLFKRFRDDDVRREARRVQTNLGSRGGPQSWRGRQSKKVKQSQKTLFDVD